MSVDNKPNRKYPHVYAIIRYDAFHGESTPIENRITVKKVVTDQGLAESEVARLNELNKDKGAYYYLQITRLEGIPTEVSATSSLQLNALEEAA